MESNRGAPLIPTAAGAKGNVKADVDTYLSYHKDKSKGKENYTDVSIFILL